ncbi:hypothetical protein GALL_316480 [mine drainage metagenome]|uniref:Uncharacterized protein n=1 Tax=mine drainage metagenome TaxID=410659 RepID=A0A1J5QSQ8_9ZZZZ
MRVIGVEEPGAPAQGAGKPGVPVGNNTFELGEGGELLLVGQVVGAQARDLDRELVVGAQQSGQVARTPRWAGSGWGGDVPRQALWQGPLLAGGDLLKESDDHVQTAGIPG